jgi:hypothetical protein
LYTVSQTDSKLLSSKDLSGKNEREGKGKGKRKGKKERVAASGPLI